VHEVAGGVGATHAQTEHKTSKMDRHTHRATSSCIGHMLLRCRVSAVTCQLRFSSQSWKRVSGCWVLVSTHLPRRLHIASTALMDSRWWSEGQGTSLQLERSSNVMD
jgi:hypothetical protein